MSGLLALLVVVAATIVSGAGVGAAAERSWNQDAVAERSCVETKAVLNVLAHSDDLAQVKPALEKWISDLERAAEQIPNDQRPTYATHVVQLRQLRTDLDGVDPGSALKQLRAMVWPAKHQVDNWNAYRAAFTTLATSTDLVEVKTALDWWVKDLTAQSPYVPEAQRPDHDRYVAWVRQLRADLEGRNADHALDVIRQITVALKQKYDASAPTPPRAASHTQLLAQEPGLRRTPTTRSVRHALMPQPARRLSASLDRVIRW